MHELERSDLDSLGRTEGSPNNKYIYASFYKGTGEE